MGGKLDTLPDEQRHIGGALTGALLGYVRRAFGDDAVARVLELADEERTAEQLTDTTTWSSYGQALSLFAAATAIGGADVARSAGEELLRQYAGTEVAALLRSLGSPVEVLRNVATTAAKYSTVSDMEAIDVSDGRVVIAVHTKPGFTRHRYFCLYTEGVLTQATPLFGLPPAVVTELECQTSGDGRCLYVVSWDAAAAEDDLEGKCAHLESELRALTSRFEALQANAAELVTAGSVDDVLRTVARRVGLAVRAPQHLLAVRVTPTGPVRVHHNGFASSDAAQSVAEELLAADVPEFDGRLVVDVATPRSWFGRIAALYPVGGRFFAQERRLLEAYAGHVAAALEAAAAFEDAQRESTTARALLHLGRELAGLGTPEDVAARLASVMSDVVDCDQQAVFLWDAERATLHLSASVGLPDEARGFFEGLAISPADTPALHRILQDPAPLFLTQETADPFIEPLIARAGLGSVAMVPITAGAEFFGVVTAGFVDPDRLQDGDADLVERLSGMADHAATALQNGRLLQQLHALALHDPLTGLPNARLLEDRVTAALHQARRNGTGLALLFIDLDEFKPVNDAFGHAAGDGVLQEAADRMRAVLRVGDTIARLAGDEFVIALPGLTDRAQMDGVVEKVSRALARPFRVGDDTVSISGSIGVVQFPDTAEDYRGLLRAADAAMYRAKRARRSGTPVLPRPEIGPAGGRHQDLAPTLPR